MRRLAWALGLLMIALLVTGQALAAPSLAVGRKNFERGRRADLNGRPDEARTYFTDAANAFAALFAERNAAGKAIFDSELTMGGISLFKAGRLEESATILEQALDQNPENYEAAVYAAMARARLGQADRALALLERYPVGAGQRRFTDHLHDIQNHLRLGRITPQAAADELEAAQRDQDVWNLAHSLGTEVPFQDKCSGAYWWRYADAPCDANFKPSGDALW